VGMPGEAPGALMPDPDPFASRATVLRFGPDRIDERRELRLEEVVLDGPELPVTWVDVQGYEDLGGLEGLASAVGVHPLALEDALTPGQRPKVERYGRDLFLVTRMLRFDQGGHLDAEQLSLYLKPSGCLVSFQEHPGQDCRDAVRARIRARRGRVREKGADYLLYALVDAVVDWYFPLLEVMGERLEELEESALDYDPMGFADEVRAIRQDLMALRRTFWPLREALTAITETEIDAFERDTLVYFGDCRDHVVQALETVESYRETAAGLLDIQLSRSSHEIAEVTKVLTLMSTVFLPLTFITGLYGMNFDPDASPWNMPELEYRYGYPLALGAMLGVGVTMLLYFVRRGWLGGRRRRKGARPRRGRRRSSRSTAPPG